jgi:chromosome segregation ATPase
MLFRRTQEKLQNEIEEMDRRERELKSKLNQSKTEILALEEQIFVLKTNLCHRDKQNSELQDSNLKMLEERVNLTSIIRREFALQIESVEEEVRNVKAKMLEAQIKHKVDLEQQQAEIDKINQEKEVEIEKIAIRVQQTIARKEETIQELQTQLDKCNFQIQHLEGLLEQQRKELIETMTKNTSVGLKRK